MRLIISYKKLFVTNLILAGFFSAFALAGYVHLVDQKEELIQMEKRVEKVKEALLNEDLPETNFYTINSIPNLIDPYLLSSQVSPLINHLDKDLLMVAIQSLAPIKELPGMKTRSMGEEIGLDLESRYDSKYSYRDSSDRDMGDSAYTHDGKYESGYTSYNDGKYSNSGDSLRPSNFSRRLEDLIEPEKFSNPKNSWESTFNDNFESERPSGIWSKKRSENIYKKCPYLIVSTLDEIALVADSVFRSLFATFPANDRLYLLEDTFWEGVPEKEDFKKYHIALNRCRDISDKEFKALKNKFPDLDFEEFDLRFAFEEEYTVYTIYRSDLD